MSELKLTTECIRYIALFESLTGARAIDCIVDDANDRVIFVVRKGDMGLAIGKRGSNINRVKKVLGREVEIVEYSEKPEEFISNALLPVVAKKINLVSKQNKRLAYVEVLPKDKGLAIGRNGRNINKAKLLAQRHYNLNDIIIQ
ncbi:MAG: NusA-like transcription termination signal-binding factor [Methanocellales archaeon]